MLVHACVCVCVCAMPTKVLHGPLVNQIAHWQRCLSLIISAANSHNLALSAHGHVQTLAALQNNVYRLSHNSGGLGFHIGTPQSDLQAEASLTSKRL